MSKLAKRPVTSSQQSFQDAPVPSWIVEPVSLRILAVNRKSEEFSGYTGGELTQRTLLDLVQPWDIDCFREALRSGDAASVELRGVTAFTHGGRPQAVDLLFGRTVYGGADALQILFLDAGPRMQLEEQLRQAQKMESVGMLAGGIAHDFNNLLTIIAGYSHMLARGLADDPKNRSAAEQVIKASDRAAALTRQLLAFSRRQVLHTRVLDLNSSVEGITPMLRRLIGENIDLRIVPGSNLGNIHSDSSHVEQVIMNLVVNARDAMPSGGKLLLETRNAVVSEPYAGKHLDLRPGPYVMLAVTDTGTGMDQKTREKAFEPFFTTKEEGRGTGLGLSMVMSIVKRAGGAVDVCSELGHGTSVKLYFPRVDRAESSPVHEVSDDPGTGWETVLLVEDEEALRTLVRTTLEAQGYHVLVAGNGKEALRASNDHDGPIHLLVTDLVMPDMNGRDVARKLHRKRRNAAVLFMSGYTDTELQNTGLPDKALHFLGKPFTPAVLARKVREVLEKNGERAADQKQHAGS